MKTLILTLCFLFSLNSIAAFDHTHKKWEEILSKYTSKTGNQVLFKYKELKKNMSELDAYLKQLESLKKDEFKKFSPDQKLAFWINAYNAFTVQIIIKNYPVKSIKEIKSGFFSSGPWKKEFIDLMGKKISLDEIEHGTIRVEFDEPRIHFAVNCASIGCPSLLQESFKASKLEDQLQRVTDNFLTNKSKNYVKGDTLYLSKIFDWYGDDFNKKHGSFKKFVIKSLNLSQKDYSVEFNNYDWDLNE